MPPSSLFGPLFARMRSGSGSGNRYDSSATSGRLGPTGPGVDSASSSVFQFTDTKSSGNLTTYKLSSDGDWVRMNWIISVTATGNSTSADVLGAISQIQILGRNGPVITMSPMPDFNYFAQRFSPLHLLPTAVIATGATAVSGAYTIYGMNLPRTGGPYTLIVTVQTAATFNTSCTALSVTYTVALGQGDCQGLQTNYSYSGLGFTPSSSGINDLSQIAAIQGLDLIEVFMSGFTTMSATGTDDINYITVISKGMTVAPHVSANDLVQTANAEMQSALYSASEGNSSGSVMTTPTLFLLFPLKTTVALGNTSHIYINWTSGTPSSTIRVGYVWLVRV